MVTQQSVYHINVSDPKYHNLTRKMEDDSRNPRRDNRIRGSQVRGAHGMEDCRVEGKKLKTDHTRKFLLKGQAVEFDLTGVGQPRNWIGCRPFPSSRSFANRRIQRPEFPSPLDRVFLEPGAE